MEQTQLYRIGRGSISRRENISELSPNGEFVLYSHLENSEIQLTQDHVEKFKHCHLQGPLIGRVLKTESQVETQSIPEVQVKSESELEPDLVSELDEDYEEIEIPDDWKNNSIAWKRKTVEAIDSGISIEQLKAFKVIQLNKFISNYIAQNFEE